MPRFPAFQKTGFKMKTMAKHFFLLLVVVSQALVGCGAQADAPEYSGYWTADSAWYKAKDTISSGKTDLLYFVSTDVVSAADASGNKLYRTLLTPEDRRAIDAELAYVETNIGQGDFNYIAPYYHQFTFEAINLPSDSFQLEYNKVVKEVCESFDYYMEHINQGRKFALVGFSQGGMLVLDVLKHMTAEQCRRMVAAYAMGYRISADDLGCGNIVPASDETTPGVTVSYNSVLDTAAVWPFVAGGAVAAINPVNWKTDSTAATFTYDGCQNTVRLEPSSRLLVVETAKAGEYRSWNGNPVYQSANVSPDCLHHWDLLFYTAFIHDNILKRAVRLGAR